MGWMRKLLGGKGSAGEERSAEALRADPSLVRAYDAHGREVFIPREDWRTNVLPGGLELNWDDPEGLTAVIHEAVDDGFHADVLDAAFHLHETHPSRVKGSSVLARVLVENGRLNEAETLLRSCMEDQGRDPTTLLALAHVFNQRGDAKQATEHLWEALEADPNLPNAVLWWAEIHRATGDEDAYVAALEEVASLEGSWFALLGLAGVDLERGNVERALARYREALDRSIEPSTLVLTQVSGDLGRAGMHHEVAALVGPRFDVTRHGLKVGNNLIKSYVELGKLAAARDILDALKALGRPDWSSYLTYWENEIDRRSP